MASGKMLSHLRWPWRRYATIDHPCCINLAFARSRSFGTGLPRPPNYLTEVFHKELQSITKEKQTSCVIFNAIWRHASRFQFDQIDLDACLNALAWCEHFDGPASEEHLLRLLILAEDVLSQNFEPGVWVARSSANIAWAIARLSVRQPPFSPEILVRFSRFFRIIEEATKPILHEYFEPCHLVLFAWAFARATAGNKPLFEDVANAAQRRLMQMQPRDVSRLLYAFAIVKYNHPVLMQALKRSLDEGGTNLDRLPEQDLANTLWASATLRLRDQSFLQASNTALLGRMHEFGVQGCVNSIWAFASIRGKPSFVHGMAEHLQRDQRWHQVEPRGCAMLLWSLATLRYDDRSATFYDFLADHCIVPHAHLYHAQDISNCLWAFATARLLHSTAFRKLGDRACSIIESFNAQSMANVAWACAKMQFRADKLLHLFAEEAQHRPLKTWPPQAVATLCWAMVEAGLRPVQLPGLAVEQLRMRAERFNDIDLATLAWIFRGEELGWPREVSDLRREALILIASQVASRRLPRTSDILGNVVSSSRTA